MIRLAMLRALHTIEAAAIATLGACVIIRGFMLDESKAKQRRDPFTGDREQPN